MKRFLICIAALLPFVLGNAQEITLVTRAEYSSVEDDHLGNSCFYALIDGDFTDNLSYSVSTHLLSSSPADLYKGTLHSNTGNWLDWANVTYDTGTFNFEIGKDMMQWGTMEMQEYDFDCYYDLTSYYWMNTVIYQWGASAGWTPTENSSLKVQMSTSPFGERPFASGLYSYALFGSCQPTKWWEYIFSFNFVQTAPGEFLKFFNMGAKFTAGDFTFNWDSTTELHKGYCGSNMLYATWAPSENFSLQARALCEQGLYEDGPDRIMGGAVLNWMPFEQLRLHALAAYDTYYGGLSYNFGVTWTISL